MHRARTKTIEPAGEEAEARAEAMAKDVRVPNGPNMHRGDLGLASVCVGAFAECKHVGLVPRDIAPSSCLPHLVLRHGVRGAGSSDAAPS